MKYLCAECLEVYEDYVVDKQAQVITEYIPCPKSKCYGELFKIDELYIPIIKTLITKGYSAVYGCSGHVYEEAPRSYITFFLHEDFLDLPYIPEGFQKEVKQYGIWLYLTMSKEYEENLNESELYKQIIQTAEVLLEWAYSLSPMF